MVAVQRKVLYCDCCGLKGMAYREGNKLIIVNKRNGKPHTLTIELDRELARPQ